MNAQWIVVAGGHARSGETMSMRFGDLNQMLVAIVRLRAFGYSLIRTYPARNKS